MYLYILYKHSLHYYHFVMTMCYILGLMGIAYMILDIGFMIYNIFMFFPRILYLIDFDRLMIKLFFSYV